MQELISVSQVDIVEAIENATGQLSKRSRRIYTNDASAFAQWILGQRLTVNQLTRAQAIAYRLYLQEHYEPATAARMLSVARRILDEQVHAGKLSVNPLQGIRGFKLENESSHIALTKEQAKELLTSIDRSALKGKRDYAIIALLIRTGIRRTECASLNIGDFSTEQGHTVATVRHGKGDKRRKIKIPVDVFRAIEDYITAANRQSETSESPLFTNQRKERISDKLIERTVIECGLRISLSHLTPHDLRATFITLAIEGGATLLQVQYAAGHSDPRTTERYQKRKINLDDNAVDYIKL